MSKILLICLVFPFLFQAQREEDFIFQPTVNNFKGQPIKLRQETFSVERKFFFKKEKRQSWELTTYGPDGNKIEYVFQTEEGVIRSASYNRAGKLVKSYYEDSVMDEKFRATFNYDSLGNEFESRLYSHFSSAENDSSLNLYKYNLKGQKIESFYFRYGDKGYSSRNLYFYDKSGNMIESRFCGSDTVTCNGRHVYSRDSLGNILEIKYYDPMDSLFGFTSYKYDEKSNCLSASYKSINYDSFIKAKYKYDSLNRLTELWFHKRGPHQYGRGIATYTHKYDEKGNLAETKLLYEGSDEPRITSFKYTNYDEQGNWLEKKEYSNGKLKWVSKREIEYY